MFERIFTLSYILLFTGICCLCAFTMLAMYSRIYIIARRHSKQIAKIHSILNKQQDRHENIKSTTNEEIVIQPKSKKYLAIAIYTLKQNLNENFKIILG